GGLHRRLRARVTLALADPIVPFVLLDARPGLAAEPLQPELRAWLRLLDDERRTALRRKRVIEIRWGEVPEALRGSLAPPDEPSPQAIARIDRRTSWIPIPVRFLHCEVQDGDRVGEWARIGFS